MRQVLYRADRIARPATSLPVAPIAVNDGWCDAPGDINYNGRVLHPYPASAERLWLEAAIYDLIVVLGYNDRPPEPGLGSAIFMHIAHPDYAPTAGCVALARADLVRLLELRPSIEAVEVTP